MQRLQGVGELPHLRAAEAAVDDLLHGDARVLRDHPIHARIAVLILEPRARVADWQLAEERADDGGLTGTKAASEHGHGHNTRWGAAKTDRSGHRSEALPFGGRARGWCQCTAQELQLAVEGRAQRQLRGFQTFAQ